MGSENYFKYFSFNKNFITKYSFYVLLLQTIYYEQIFHNYFEYSYNILVIQTAVISKKKKKFHVFDELIIKFRYTHWKLSVHYLLKYKDVMSFNLI